MIKLFKLTSGETIICDCEKNLDDEWVIKRPYTIMVVPQHSGHLGVMLMDFIFGAKDNYEITLKNRDIIGSAIDPDLQMLRMWDSKMAELLKKETGIEVISRI